MIVFVLRMLRTPLTAFWIIASFITCLSMFKSPIKISIKLIFLFSFLFLFLSDFFLLYFSCYPLNYVVVIKSKHLVSD